jgi:hypothetical protein
MIAFFRADTGRVVKVSSGHDAIPEGCESIELDAAATALAAEGRSLLVVDGLVVEDLAALEAMLFTRIDAEAGAARACLLTIAPGQELTYLDKEAEARRLVDGVDPDPAAFPMLAPEAQACGVDLGTLAVIVIEKADESRRARGAIEALKAGAKMAVAAAEGRAAKEAAAVVNWGTTAS